MSYYDSRRLLWKQYEGDRTVRTRHLLYHVYPSRKNDIWKRNVDRLMEHASLFNGRRIVAVATGPGSLTFDEVANYLTGLRAETVEAINDADLREVTTFPYLISRVADLGWEDAVFYAHTKGNSTIESVLGATIWRNIGYAYLLGGWQRCMRLLLQYPAVGIHKIHWGKQLGPYPNRLRNGNWMFAGTFFWFRPSVTHAFDNWRNVPLDRYGAEAWLAGLLEHDMGASAYQIWPEVDHIGVNPYEPEIYPIGDRMLYGEGIEE